VISSKQAYNSSLGLVNQIVKEKKLESTAFYKAKKMANYSQSSFVNTKAVIVRKLINGLKDASILAKKLYK
jgi:hypothetical protein